MKFSERAVRVNGTVALEAGKNLAPDVQNIPAEPVGDPHSGIRKSMQLVDFESGAVPMGDDDTTTRCPQINAEKSSGDLHEFP